MHVDKGLEQEHTKLRRKLEMQGVSPAVSGLRAAILLMQGTRKELEDSLDRDLEKIYLPQVEVV